ncbi:MAG: hypothetical protein A2445_02710 [Candidatus Jacksonbacteria bacterium RIFOXYC2_FULL_44_29]|nr:MAG: hypothetical protein UV19_C0002G0045 [Parcubacteria group bacterium GW2011_GWA2_42_28]KKT55913.1 MAG: hypothetical protein UW45_C0003G0046 [Parcubacteria group bacterium GW2011_GWC2_44_22]OGY74526.1 MAG: hypothetical protein A2240_02965 [Candidatus Jacksonbacteria bacterium RIFOXYA2_FULL_43_12]OGY77436.1 MAG: hypothetical protein A2295_01915 [Candidatus Jacksonbacteria bacterium RIFOXYB2_FULL_44_15]OGY78208.1 MAG: hypothetical protein A2550_06260 [Candidatus Jacksonbacteria bacterium RI
MPYSFLTDQPSKITNDYWVFAEREIGEYPEHTASGGKWLLFVNIYSIDKIWAKIKIATEKGRLGGMAKAATVKINPDFPNSKIKVICVYTYDWKDELDVKRIREELRMIGITRKISYKADEDTELGKYRTDGSEKLSKYYE